MQDRDPEQTADPPKDPSAIEQLVFQLSSLTMRIAELDSEIVQTNRYLHALLMTIGIAAGLVLISLVTLAVISSRF